MIYTLKIPQCKGYIFEALVVKDTPSFQGDTEAQGSQVTLRTSFAAHSNVTPSSWLPAGPKQQDVACLLRALLCKLTPNLSFSVSAQVPGKPQRRGCGQASPRTQFCSCPGPGERQLTVRSAEIWVFYPPETDASQAGVVGEERLREGLADPDALSRSEIFIPKFLSGNCSQPERALKVTSQT